MAKGAPTEEKMQKDVNQVSDSCDSYDLTISIRKTEMVYQPAPRKPYKEPTIAAKDRKLHVVEFTHLGSTLSRVVHIIDEVNARIAKASATFDQLRGSIWDQSGIRLDIKAESQQIRGAANSTIRMRNLDSLPTACQWLNHFNTSCLRKLLKIEWQDRISDTDVLKRAEMQSVHTLLKLALLRWTCHLTRMPDERFPKKIFYGELQVGKCSHSGQKKRYKDTPKPPLKTPTESLEQIAQELAK